MPQNASLMDRLAAVLASKSNDTAMGRGSSIGKAQCGGLSAIGGQVRQMGSATANSIWNPDKLAQIKDEELTQGERIKADNKKLAESRIQARKEHFHIDEEALKAAMVKGNTVQANSAHATNASNYSSKVAPNQFSIFDVGPMAKGAAGDKLDKFPELTAGERIKAAAAERKAKKEAARKDWQKISGTTSTRAKLSDLFKNYTDTRG